MNLRSSFSGSESNQYSETLYTDPKVEMNYIYSLRDYSKECFGVNKAPYWYYACGIKIKTNEGKLLMSDDSSNNETRIYFCDLVNGHEIEEYANYRYFGSWTET
jgi:hypothetical protein